MAKRRDDQPDTSRRNFLRRSSSVAGAVATAGLVGEKLVRKVERVCGDEDREELKKRYEADALRQERLMKQKKLVLMSRDEKERMLDEIIRHHHKSTA